MEEQLPKWDSVGVEPPAVLKTDGWQPGMKPSAQHMNWLFNRIYKCLEEIQTNGGTEEIQQELAALQALVAEHQADEMPHEFTDATDLKTYRYGFKTNAAKDGLVFVYEEVL
ncbi:hypothetical protein [Cytobacillus firmus]|uniref:Uncharacterized protein n=1 Tax=Cytobacillus firmus DS1 TaxID=1307436 RepID=W7LC45_CYTFI|nr:hypothetical protein [Cytobacillus firmus]EWG12756.1 hypothetical protein PBF_04435 [Cytobacillus firmus DS1]